MESNIKQNFVYQILYQILISLLPFITSPYISRVIGAEGIGIYSYTFSIVQYFILFGKLGIGYYGNRLIARTRDEKEEMNRAFSSLFALHLVLYLIVILAYIFYVFLLAGAYRFYACMQMLYLISGAIDISWLFFGLEKFRLTVSRNSIIKIITVCSVFLFVKSESDLWIYILILALGNFLSQAVLWGFLGKYVSFSKFEPKEMLVHLRPLFTLFFAEVAVSVFSYMDKIMIAGLSSATELGYYENAWKMIEFPVTFVTALGTVTLPRISNFRAAGREKEIIEYIFKSLRFSLFAALAIMFGLLAVADDFSVVFWGADFARSGRLMMILSPAILLMAWNGVIRQEYLVPYQKDRSYLAAVCVGALLNLTANALLIRQYGAAGAAVGTVIAYLGIFVVQNFAARGRFGFKKAIVRSIPYMMIALVMFALVSIFSCSHERNALNLILEVMLGISSYFGFSIIYAAVLKDRFILDMLHSVLGKIKNRS